MISAGGFPIFTGQPIDLSSPNSSLIMALAWVADGAPRNKKREERIALSVKVDITWRGEPRYQRPLRI